MIPAHWALCAPARHRQFPSRRRPALTTESGGPFFFLLRAVTVNSVIWLSSATVALRGRVRCGSPSGFAGGTSQAPHTSSTELLTQLRTPADWAALRLPEWVFASFVQGWTCCLRWSSPKHQTTTRFCTGTAKRQPSFFHADSLIPMNAAAAPGSFSDKPRRCTMCVRVCHRPSHAPF